CSSGVSASADVVASVSSKSGLTGSWTIGGTTAKAASSGVATFTDLTCTLLSAGTGAINFACGTPAVDSNSFTIPKKSAVTLTPDMTDNDVDHDIVINFTHDSDFETAISGVSYNGTALTATTDYIVGSGTITLKPGGGNAALTTATDNKNVVVTAAGYNDSSVSQTIMAGAVASLTLTAQPSPDSTSGLAFSTQPVVTLKDQYGNVCSSGVSASADVVASVSSKSGLTGSWTIGGMTTRAASSGVATFTDLTCTLLGTGTGAINFACGTPAIDSDSFTIPKKSAVTLTPDTMDNDVDHDIVISFTHDSDFETAISGVSYNGTALTATKDYIIGSGMITLKPGGGNAALTTATDSRNIIVTAPGYNDSSVSQTITAGAVASLTVTTQPSPDSTSGLAFSTQPVVTLKDQYGNVCSSGVSASADVVASVSSKSGLTGSWTIGGMTTKAASSGVATFTDLTCTLVAAGTGAINFACGTPAVDSNSFTIPKKSAVALTPDMTDNDVDHDLNITFTADSDFAAAITGVTYNGNMLNSSQYTVDTTNNNMITLHPGIGGNTYLRTPGNASLTIIAAGYNDSSVSQTIMAGAVASLTLTAQPSPASTSGLAFSTQPVVTLKDQYGNVCSSGVSASADVVASVSSKSGLTGSWTIGGMTTKAASSGVATFTDLTCTLVTAGTGAINFACGTPAVDSNSFTIPKKTAVTLIPDTTDNDVDHDIVITFTHDSDFETAISGVSYNGTALTATTDYIVGSGTITLKPGGGNKVLRTASDSKNVIVKATGYGNSGVIQTIKSGTAKSILITTQPVPGSTSGDAFASQPVVKIVDQYGNTCTSGLSATLEVRAAAKGVTGSWTIGGTTTRAASSGIATFTDLTCTLAASGTGKISFSCNGGGMSLDSNSFTIPERNSSIMPTSASFDRYSGSTGYVDIAVIMTLNSNTLNAVKNGTATLIKGTDYTVSSDTCTISRTYLAKLTKGTAQFTFDFNFGADPVLSITITDSTPSDGGNGGEGPSTIGNGGVNIIVNGQSLTSGTSETTTNSNGQTTTTVTVDTHKLESVLDTQGMGATVTIPVAGGSDVASGVLTGDIVKTMETKDATLEIRTDSAVYTVPASEININAVSSQLGTSVTLSDIKVNVSIGEPADATFKVIADAASKGGYTVQVPAVDFTISCTYNGQTVNVSSFNSYVERMVSIPKGVDPNKITTGVVVKPDGTAYHVPTQVVVIGGVYYAKINSLTNSTYTVVWHPVEFTDMDGHWAKNAVNDMGSRMVIDGVGNNNFEPDRKMTRAEFASIIVKALGLAPGIGTDNFNDVTPADWFFGYVKTATKYGIIEGYNSKTFGPNDLITREQAMTMITRAMKITGLTVNLTDEEINGLLKAYSDSKSASSYAKRSIATCLQTGIVEGKDGSVIAPKSYVTRAEVAVMAQRLLQKSKLI
ncbi:MAG TPA: S-layer homology domain-containing protein, partial [Clostridia bacterium]|nr:S-layer homology domain-containing protein [Clostridia bacterium]